MIQKGESQQVGVCGKECLTKAIAFSIIKRHKKKHKHLKEAYYCKECKSWHTSKKKKLDKKRSIW